MSQAELAAFGRPTAFTDGPGSLTIAEHRWLRCRTFFEEAGYTFRAPRYQEGWVPSWKGTKRFYQETEDGQVRANIMFDAIRTSDGVPVIMKPMSASKGPHELELTCYVNTEPLASDPRNHSVKLLDVLNVPEMGTLDDEPSLVRRKDVEVLVFPLLRPWNSPSFDTVGEVMAMLTQMLEGIHFLHDNHVAHRDCTYNNLMMDPTTMYPESFHPIANNRSRDYKRHAKHYTRTQRPPRYVWIDYGHSRRYNPEDGPPLELPQLAGDKSPPEHNGPNQNIPCDPFATDIYFLGNFIRLHIYQNYFGFQFIYPLISDMTKADPSKRPKIDEVVARYHKILGSLSGWKLRSGLIKRKEIVLSVYKLVPHFIRTIGYVCAGLPSIPNP